MNMESDAQLLNRQINREPTFQSRGQFIGIARIAHKFDCNWIDFIVTGIHYGACGFPLH